MKTGDTNDSAHRTPLWLLGGIVLTLLTILVLLQSSNLWKNLAVETASDTVLLFALSSLNFFALVIFGFIFFRNLLKLVRERRALQLGSKIKTRLLLYFFAVSLLPLVAMAVFSYLFLNRAIDRFFTQIPENAIREAREVQRRAVEDQTVKLNETTRMLAQTLENEAVSAVVLREITEAGNLSHVSIWSKDGAVIARSEKTLAAEQKHELEQVLTFIRENRLGEQSLSDGRGFDAAAVDLSDGRRLVIVPGFRGQETVSSIIDNSLVEFEDLKTRQITVRQIGLWTLGLLTFLLFFASSWTAFYIAKGLTAPIKSLAEGADEIARGNLSHRVDVLAEDELALLVASFNQMSAKLEENSAELETRRRYIETILQSLATGVISFDAENRVATINQAAMHILKLEDADFTGFELNKLVNDENRAVLETLINRAKRIGQAAEQTVLQRESTDGRVEIGENLPVALTARALPNENGVVLVIEDLSELITAQRAAAWQEVARRMAHEIKNPLTPIQLAAERIAKRFASQKNGNESGKQNESKFLNRSDFHNSEQQSSTNGQLTKIINESTETILREVSSLKSMVDEFSQYARLPDARLESGNLNEVIKQVVALYEDRFSDAVIQLRLAENLPPAMIDAEQLKRVFVNLIDNAIEAFNEDRLDKQITVKTFYDKARDIIVAEIADNGSGISPADFQKLFQPYFSTKGRGTGLGLAIVQRIVSEHHGKIKAVSNQPKGAKFIVELPVNV